MGARRAARALKSDPRLEVSVVNADTTRHASPDRGVLRIESASLLSTAISVLWAPAMVGLPAAEDIELALTRAAWEQAPYDEAWRRLAAPLPRAAHIGSIDRTRPWIVVDATSLDAARGRKSDGQLHHIGLPKKRPRPGVVYWRTRPNVVAPLLSRASLVVAGPGPLAWDAIRAGVSQSNPATDTANSKELTAWRLSYLLPATLLDVVPFWRSLATQIMSARTPTDWGTRSWLLRGRGVAADEGPQRAWARKLRKLQRDPRAFFRDARHPLLRTVGDKMLGPSDRGSTKL